MDEVTKMEKEYPFDIILSIVKEFINSLLLDLVAVPGIDQLGYKFSSEVWINNNGIGLGALSCLRSPIDEAIELTIDLKQTEKAISVEIGVYWSNGTVLQEISSLQIQGDNLGNQLLSFLERNRKEVIETLGECLMTNSN